MTALQREREKARQKICAADESIGRERMSRERSHTRARTRRNIVFANSAPPLAELDNGQATASAVAFPTDAIMVI